MMEIFGIVMGIIVAYIVGYLITVLGMSKVEVIEGNRIDRDEIMYKSVVWPIVLPIVITVLVFDLMKDAADKIIAWVIDRRND